MALLHFNTNSKSKECDHQIHNFIALPYKISPSDDLKTKLGKIPQSTTIRKCYTLNHTQA